MNDELVIAGKVFKSRLIVGTGKYRNFPEMARAIEASGADMVTVAVRRVNLSDKTKESLLDHSIARNIFCCPTPRAATPPTKQSAPLASAAKPASPNG